MSHTAKLFESIIFNRIRAKIEQGQSEEEHRFRARRSTEFLIFAICYY